MVCNIHAFCIKVNVQDNMYLISVNNDLQHIGNVLHESRWKTSTPTYCQINHINYGQQQQGDQGGEQFPRLH